MAATLIAHTAANGTGAGSTTTAGINTTGATLLLVAVASNSVNTTISDSKGNTWYCSPLGGTNPTLTLCFSIPTTVGSGHTFTTVAGGFSGVGVQAWSGVSIFPQQVATATATTVATASITPPVGTTATGLFIATFGSATAAGTIAIDSSFTVSDSLIGVGAQSFGIGMAYKVSASAEAPTWTQTIGACVAGLVCLGIIGSASASSGGSYGFA